MSNKSIAWLRLTRRLVVNWQWLLLGNRLYLFVVRGAEVTDA